MPNSGLDTTMQHVLVPSGSPTSMKHNTYDSTNPTAVGGSDPSPNDGSTASQLAPNTDCPALHKPADNGIISPKFYEEVQGSPGTFDTTMESVLELNFSR